MTISNAFRYARHCAILAGPFCLGMTTLSAQTNADADAQAPTLAEARVGAEWRSPADSLARATGREPAADSMARVADRSPAADGTSLWSAAPTVETLLQLDTQAALVAERKRIDRLLAIVRPSASSRMTAGASPSRSHEAQQDTVVLNAIYGVGGALTAELTIDGERQRLRVRSRARSARDENEGDGIVRIDHVRQCVVLRQAGVERSACLTPAGPSFTGDPAQTAPANARAASDAASGQAGALTGSVRATPVLFSAGGAR